jgi:predicted dinucleotide-binding enzyme
MKIMVVGAGQMGLGIAQVMADAGHTTLVNNLDHTPPEQGIRQIADRLTPPCLTSSPPTACGMRQTATWCLKPWRKIWN